MNETGGALGVPRRAAGLLQGVLARASPLAGGDLSEIFRIRLADGREAVVKSGPAPRTEAAMLAALAAAGAPVPRVLAVDAAILVLEYLTDDGSAAPDDLARVLKGLHGAIGTAYGWHADYAFGPVAIENTYTDNWPVFWATRRLLVHAPHVEGGLARRLAALASRLGNFLPARPAASLLHGDLWGGNVLTARGRVCGLIDPACYYGDGEVDLAMLALFGQIHPAFTAVYGDLPLGWQDRRAIYQLWPALVHLRLFGPGYRPLVDRLLTSVGA